MFIDHITAEYHRKKAPVVILSGYDFIWVSHFFLILKLKKKKKTHMDLFIPLISFMFLCISSWTSYLNFSVATGYTNSLTVSLCTEPVSLVFLTYLSMLKKVKIHGKHMGIVQLSRLWHMEWNWGFILQDR